METCFHLSIVENKQRFSVSYKFPFYPSVRKLAQQALSVQMSRRFDGMSPKKDDLELLQFVIVCNITLKSSLEDKYVDSIDTVTGVWSPVISIRLIIFDVRST